MSPDKNQTISLSKWVDSKQSQGRYSFTREEALLETGLKDDTLSKAALRLAGERRIARLHSGFYVIVPLEYRSHGITPADWFIADLMAYLRQPYYVGLLSAAAYHGASHQRAQQYHVITNQRTRQVKCHNLILRFFTKAEVMATPRDQIKTSTGMMAISTPEATALDLVAYYRQVGGLDRVLTVLQELGEKMEPGKIVDVCSTGWIDGICTTPWMATRTNGIFRESIPFGRVGSSIERITCDTATSTAQARCSA